MELYNGQIVKVRLKGGKRFKLEVQFEDRYGYFCLPKNSDDRYFFISKKDKSVHLFDEVAFLCIKEDVGRMVKP